jgi:hypothetical protein
MSVAQAQQVHCGLPIFQNGYVQPQQQQPMPHPTYSATHKQRTRPQSAAMKRNARKLMPKMVDEPVVMVDQKTGMP